MPRIRELIAHLHIADQSAIQRAAGQFLIGRNLTQRIPIFEGEANSGKSTLAQILETIVGNQACTELRTEHLAGRFEAYRFHQKSLLIGSVPHDFLLQDGAVELKKITGGDLISAEKKGSNEVFQFHGDLNVLITSNSRLILRLFSDASAWRRRLVIIDFPFSGRAAEQNKEDYANQLLNREASGILNWALEGAQQLLQDLAEGKGFVLTDDQKKRVDDRINESDSLALFLNECLRTSDIGSLTTKQILDSYSSYCRARGWGYPGEKAVSHRLNNLMSSIFGAQPSNHIKDALGGDEKRGYRGVCLNLKKTQNSAVDSTDDGDGEVKIPATFTRIHSRN